MYISTFVLPGEDSPDTFNEEDMSNPNEGSLFDASVAELNRSLGLPDEQSNDPVVLQAQNDELRRKIAETKREIEQIKQRDEFASARVAADLICASYEDANETVRGIVGDRGERSEHSRAADLIVGTFEQANETVRGIVGDRGEKSEHSRAADLIVGN